MIKNKTHNILLTILKYNPLFLKKELYLVLVLFLLMPLKGLASDSDIDTGVYVKGAQIYGLEHIHVVNKSADKPTHVYVGTHTKVYGLDQLTHTQIQTIKIPENKNTSQRRIHQKINSSSIKITITSKQKKKYQSSKTRKTTVKSVPFKGGVPFSSGTLLKNGLAAISIINIRAKSQLLKRVIINQISLGTSLYTYVMPFHNAVLPCNTVYNKTYTLQTFFKQLYSRPPPFLV